MTEVLRTVGVLYLIIGVITMVLCLKEKYDK